MMDAHVYCTNCKNFRMYGDGDYNIDCEYKDQCNLLDPEDSRPLSDRPHYEGAVLDGE